MHAPAPAPEVAKTDSGEGTDFWGHRIDYLLKSNLYVSEALNSEKMKNRDLKNQIEIMEVDRDRREDEFEQVKSTLLAKLSDKDDMFHQEKQEFLGGIWGDLKLEFFSNKEALLVKSLEAGSTKMQDLTKKFDLDRESFLITMSESQVRFDEEKASYLLSEFEQGKTVFAELIQNFEASLSGALNVCKVSFQEASEEAGFKQNLTYLQNLIETKEKSTQQLHDSHRRDLKNLQDLLEKRDSDLEESKTYMRSQISILQTQLTAKEEQLIRERDETRSDIDFLKSRISKKDARNTEDKATLRAEISTLEETIKTKDTFLMTMCEDYKIQIHELLSTIQQKDKNIAKWNDDYLRQTVDLTNKFDVLESQKKEQILALENSVLQLREIIAAKDSVIGDKDSAYQKEVEDHKCSVQGKDDLILSKEGQHKDVVMGFWNKLDLAKVELGKEKEKLEVRIMGLSQELDEKHKQFWTKESHFVVQISELRKELAASAEILVKKEENSLKDKTWLQKRVDVKESELASIDGKFRLRVEGLEKWVQAKEEEIMRVNFEHMAKEAKLETQIADKIKEFASLGQQKLAIENS
jgi:hypothetical protein